MNNIFLLLGSNLGNRQLFLQKATVQIETEAGLVVQRSSVYETQSWGKTDAPDYLNQVLQVTTDLPAEELLDRLLAIELQLGRRREEKWGSRTIDIDILFYGTDVVIKTGLVIPHPQLHKRRFTMVPLAEIAPAFIHPVLQKSMLQLKDALEDNLIVKKILILDIIAHMYQPSPDQDLDLSFLYEIADGNDEFIVESITMFVDQTPDLIQNIADALEAKDWVAAGAAAHKLKPNFGFFGMPLCQSLVQDIETLCREGALNAEEINTKFSEARTLLTTNLILLAQMKAEKQKRY